MLLDVKLPATLILIVELMIGLTKLVRRSAASFALAIQVKALPEGHVS